MDTSVSHMDLVIFRLMMEIESLMTKQKHLEGETCGTISLLVPYISDLRDHPFSA